MAMGRVNLTRYLPAHRTDFLDECLGPFYGDKGIEKSMHDEYRRFGPAVHVIQGHEFLVVPTDVKDVAIEKFL